ncbi:MAG: tyrosine--tRNA ligase [Candidatus Aureabacteria bacterium]|nr:tyrosine--tRNA ligase [Candidatus Auribacterota bacterium]
MKSGLPAKEQLKILVDKCEAVISEEELYKKLEVSVKKKKPLIIKYGADPSAPDIHLGHTVVIQKLRSFQDLGHQIVFLIGDFTAMIGDPSGRSRTRKPLTKEQVMENARTYQDQIFKILDRKKTKVVYNSDWLDKMSFSDIISLASRYTVARMLERDDFSKRYSSGSPITILEFLYPLIQGYDSVVIDTDVEMGGTDQTFNMLVGRDIQREYGKHPQVVMSMPILEGTDGVQKMSKSLGNYIGITEAPDDIFGKIMSISDDLMMRYFSLLTESTGEDIKSLKQAIKAGKRHPMDAKKELAYILTKRFHGEEKAEKATKHFEKVFSKRENPENIQEMEYSEKTIWIVKVLRDAGFVSSASEARRLISQGGVKVGDEKLLDPQAEIPVEGQIIRCGKRNFLRLKKKK